MSADYNERWEPYKKKVLACGDQRVRDGAFRASDVSHSIGMDDTLDCSRMLKEMCERDRSLIQAPPGKSGSLRYRIKPRYNFTSMKIRKLTNKQLGIEPTHLGAPE